MINIVRITINLNNNTTTATFHIDTTNHIIEITKIKMNQNDFSYNGTKFTKVDDNTVKVEYNKYTYENTQDGIDYNLTWAINDILNVLHEYSKAGHNPYNKDYKMFEFEF